MNEVYFIGGPFDLTKRVFEKVDGVIRMYAPVHRRDNRAPPLLPYQTVECQEIEYLLRQIPPAPNGNARWIAVML